MNSNIRKMETITTSNVQLESRSFTCFPRLPLELRQIIFKTAALETKIVAVEVGGLLRLLVNGGKHFLAPINPSSSLLRVNHEARKEYLTICTAHHQPESGEPKVYINKSIGILWCTNFEETTFGYKFPAFIPKNGTSTALKIRRLATGWEKWPTLLSRSGKHYKLTRIIQRMRSLGVEEVLIVMKPSNRFAMPWEYSNVEFRDAQEIDPANEPIHWKLIRDSLEVSEVSVRNVEKAMGEYIEQTRNRCLGHIKDLLASEVSAGEMAHDNERSAYASLGGCETWTVQKFRFVEAVNLTGAKSVGIQRPKTWEVDRP